MLLIIIVILCLACPFVSQKSILDHIWFWFLLKFNVLLFILKLLIILASVGGSNKDLTQLLARVPFLSSWQVTSASVCSERRLGSVPPRVCLTLHSTEISQWPWFTIGQAGHSHLALLLTTVSSFPFALTKAHVAFAGASVIVSMELDFGLHLSIAGAQCIFE